MKKKTRNVAFYADARDLRYSDYKFFFGLTAPLMAAALC